jgi:transcriptional regulator with XRE-family HTH domain
MVYITYRAYRKDRVSSISFSEGEMSPAQCRAARGWLGWSQEKLADEAGVSLSTLISFEVGRHKTIRSNLKAIEDALYKHGMRFVFKDEKPLAVAFDDTSQVV